MPFDLGLLDDGTLRRRFAEAVGWGAFAATVAIAKPYDNCKTVRETLKRDRKLFRAVAKAVPPRHYAIEIDGRDLSGDYLLVDVMNVPLLGPRLRVSPLSDPSDGSFELVLATSEHRSSLEELASTGSVTRTLPLRVERGRRLRIETSEPVLHLDGRLWRHATGAHRFDISVEANAIQYLCAPGTRHKPESGGISSVR